MKNITTTAHAMAVGLYVLMAIIGATWAAGLASMAGARALFGLYAHAAIGLAVTLAAVTGALCAVTSRLFPRPDGVLRVELWCCTVLALGFAAYWLSIFGKAATTELLAIGLVLVSLARVIQIWAELRRIR